MKKTITLLFTLFLFFNGKSQTNYEDVVYLKNGSIIHGVIIEQVPGISIKIKNHLNDVLFYKIDEIEKMTKEEPTKTNASQPSKEEAKEIPKYQTKRAWRFDSVKIKTTGIIEIGGLFGIAADHLIKVGNNAGTTYTPATKFVHGSMIGPTTNLFNLKIAIDKMLNRRLSIGGGLGLDISKTDPISEMSPTVAIFLPAFMDIRYSFLKRRFSPYISGQAGASFYAGNEYTGKVYGGGALAAVQVGLKVFASSKVALMLALGYRFQHITYEGNTQFTDNQGNNVILATSKINMFLHYVTFSSGIAF
jgi:hypothetical protein